MKSFLAALLLLTNLVLAQTPSQKRPFTFEDMSAEYILNEGNPNVVLCERGIRTFDNSARYTLDLSAVPILKSKTHLPVIVDPTHALGLREFVPQMSLAAVAAGADALMIEVHDSPEQAKSDGNQALTPEIFAELVPRLRAVAAAIGREM